MGHPPPPLLSSSSMAKKVLVLHGNRQTGELLLGRLERLKKAAACELGWQMVAADAPHFHFADDDDLKDNDASDHYDNWQRTWWHRKGNVYTGLEESVDVLLDLWEQGGFIGILGFSQGSRLAHIISLMNIITNGSAFNGLKFVIHSSGYGDCPLPENLAAYLTHRWEVRASKSDLEKLRVTIPSLHIMGERDKLIHPKSSLALMEYYQRPAKHMHPGGHHVPMKAVDIPVYLEFFNDVDIDSKLQDEMLESSIPDEEHVQTQIDEVSALSQIFPDELKLLSESTLLDDSDPQNFSEESRTYQHPIKYSILLQPQDGLDPEAKLWPPKQISLGIQYPPDYPDSSPNVTLLHEMNYLEFSMQQSDALMNVIRNTMEEESGMPCVMGMIYAARDFFESGGLAAAATSTRKENNQPAVGSESHDIDNDDGEVKPTSGSLRSCSAKRNAECNEQGLEIAYEMLSSLHSDDVGEVNATRDSMGKGGSWKYTIGLVGKPSSGKSTFFNAATAFARQRGMGGGAGNRDGTEDDGDAILGGAAMAAHPFTTIDPNVGFCLVPAPAGCCPEDDESCVRHLSQKGLILGSTHGRDSKGRRLVSLCLKDVAGLVPGAYQGHGKGNKFLDDLTDADCLIHVVDASGMSDTEGNIVTSDEMSTEANHPIKDLAWQVPLVRNELVQWVYFNISSKWDGVVRRGRDKLVGMFSGYKQSQSFVLDVFSAVERYVREKEGRDHIFEDLQSWDEGDLHRLISAFLGMRFPMALALNKADLPSSTKFINDIDAQLPIHGALVGTGLSAHKEMQFMRHCIGIARKGRCDSMLNGGPLSGNVPIGVWDCLQCAMTLRPPVLCFPVNDMNTLEPLPGMTNYSTRDASLPNEGMISCLIHAGGCAPSHWDSEKQIYAPSIPKSEIKPALRDVILMKPGSTVEDVFHGLKWIGALEGEFVRAEGACNVGDKPKLVSKSDTVGKHNRILRIMTTKRKVWQKNSASNA